MRLTKECFQSILHKIIRNSNETLIVTFAFDNLAPENIAQLLTALYQNTTTHTLNLGVNFLQKESIVLLASYLSTHHSIEKLELGGNEMGDENAKLLLNALETNCGIKILNLKDNYISDELIPSIKQLLKNNTTLQLVNLTANNFSKDGIQELIKITNIHCILQLNSKDPEYLRVTRAAKHKIKLLFNLQIYIRYVLYDNQKYNCEAKAAKKANLRNIIGNTLQNLRIGEGINESIDFFINLIKSSSETDEFLDPVSFINLCLERNDLTNMLLYEIISLPDSHSRDEILYTIANALFCSEISCYQSMINLINAHICFLNINNKTAGINRMVLESYRSLVAALGLEVDELDLRRWKQEYGVGKPHCNFTNIFARIDCSIADRQRKLLTSPVLPAGNNDELLMLLFVHRTKAAVQHKITHSRSMLTIYN